MDGLDKTGTSRQRLWWLPVILFFCLFIITGCTTASMPVVPATAMPSSTATLVPSATPEPTVTPEPTRTPRPTETPLKITTDISYTLSLQPDVRTRALDIFAPVAQGEWPVIILAHGSKETKARFERMGKALAREGAVVFVIDWPAWATAASATTGDGSWLREMTETFICAVRFAHVQAALYTQTPDAVTLLGYSLGGWPGLLTSLAGDELEAQWAAYEASHGNPPDQVSCVITEGTAHVDAFVGYGGLYPTTPQGEGTPADFWEIMDISRHMGENTDVRIRAIQGIYDTVLSEQNIEHAETLILAFADAGYDAQWIEIEDGHGFNASGSMWEHNRQVIMDVMRP